MHPHQAQQPIQVVLNPVVVMERVGLDEAGILAGVKAGTFPKPIKFDGRVVWKEPDIQEWIAARIAAGDERVIALHPLLPAMERLIDVLTVEFIKEQSAVPPSP